MGFRRLFSAVQSHWIGFGIALTLTVTLYTLYGLNIVRWQNSPDFGWRTMFDSGPNVVAEVFERARAAGLQAGDKIQAINGRRYSTFDELFSGNIRQDDPGSLNTYTVVRDGTPVEIAIPTGRLGLRTVLRRSGPLFAIGLIYVIIGALVFLMKPRATESWLFFLMACLIGTWVSYTAPSDLIRPTWLYDVRFAIKILLAASMIHLALRFPKTRTFLTNMPWVQAIPYLLSLALFILLEATTTVYWTIPRPLFLASDLYIMLAVLIFLGSMAWNAFRDHSIIIRLQSQVILAGIVLGFLIPSMDLLSRFLWHAHLIPDPAIGFGVFLGLFPLSIGYTIVKHDLFAIDVIVRRTYGYVLSTGAVVASYAAIVSFLNIAFRGSDVARSPLFSISFALGVIVLFGPLHRRIQRFVDRTFYRQQYDYRTTIKGLSEAMTSILDPDLVLKTLVGAVVKEMFLENGVLLLPRPAGEGYAIGAAQGLDPQVLSVRPLSDADPLLRLVKEKKTHVVGHDIALNPIYDRTREEIQQTLHALSAELLLPMTYKDELRGILSLGRKKSGKLFTTEDLDLLKTMLSQSAIALENAHLFKENLEKGRMEEELKIAHDIQMGMLPERAPQFEGLTIAARTIPAREVGGDFYDFVEVPPSNGSGGRVGIIVGDVSGKGVSAGLLMAGARSTYRVLLDGDPAVDEVMTLANQRLHRDIRKGMFVALVYAVLDPGARTLTLSNAGQTQPVLCQPGADPSHITTEGDTFPLGIVPDCDYQQAEVSLAPGSVVVFYTDGVVEAMNAQQELYGFDRFLAAVHAGRDLDGPALLDKLLGDIARFVGGTEQHDDITIIVARVG